MKSIFERLREFWRDTVGAVTITIVSETANAKIVDIIATADADTRAVVTHNFGVAPRECIPEPLLAVERLSEWVVTARTTTNVEVSKSTAVGSGDAANQIRYHIKLPHSETA